MITNLSCLMIMHDVRLQITKGSKTRQGILKGFPSFRWKIPRVLGFHGRPLWRLIVNISLHPNWRWKNVEGWSLSMVMSSRRSRSTQHGRYLDNGHGIGHFTTINWLHNIYNWSDMNRISPFSSFILGMYHIGDVGTVSLDCYFFILFV